MKQSGNQVSAVAPTNDTQSSPDELRKWALGFAGQPNPDPVSVALAAADAWEAERAKSISIFRIHKERFADYRKRLEASEKVPTPIDRQTARHLAKMIEETEFSPYRDCGVRLKAFGRWLAALAGEKETK